MRSVTTRTKLSMNFRYAYQWPSLVTHLLVYKLDVTYSEVLFPTKFLGVTVEYADVFMTPTMSRFVCQTLAEIPPLPWLNVGICSTGSGRDTRGRPIRKCPGVSTSTPSAEVEF